MINCLFLLLLPTYHVKKYTMLDKKRREVLIILSSIEVNESRNFVFASKSRYRNFREAFKRIIKPDKKFTFRRIDDLEYKVIRIL